MEVEDDPKLDLYIMEASVFNNLCFNLAKPCICSGQWNLRTTRRVSQ